MGVPFFASLFLSEYPSFQGLTGYRIHFCDTMGDLSYSLFDTDTLMPIRTTYDQVNHGVELYYTGTVNADEISQAISSIATSIEVANVRFCISDRTNCERLRVDSDDINKSLIQIKSLGDLHPQLILAFISPDSFGFGMSRMFGTKGESVGLTTMVFRDRDSADAWIANETKN